MSSDWGAIVEDESAKKEILHILSNHVSREILSHSQIPMSLLMLTRELGVSIEVAEAKVSELLDLGLLATVRSPGSATGSAYRSLIHEASMRLEPQGITLTLRINGFVSPKTARSLLQISRPVT